MAGGRDGGHGEFEAAMPQKGHDGEGDGGEAGIICEMGLGSKLSSTQPVKGQCDSNSGQRLRYLTGRSVPSSGHSMVW